MVPEKSGYPHCTPTKSTVGVNLGAIEAQKESKEMPQQNVHEVTKNDDQPETFVVQLA